MALHLGKSLQELSQVSEREFRRWALYADKYMLPQRRIELYLAQIALWVARSGGAEDVGLEDFLFDPPEEIDLATAIGFNPKKKVT